MWDKNTGHGLVPVDKIVPEIKIYWPMERAIKIAVILTDNKREWDDRKAECEVKSLVGN